MTPPEGASAVGSDRSVDQHITTPGRDSVLFDVPEQYVARGAVISECGTYRYVLWRQWGPEKPLGFVMLNPSTADAEKDDPTIKRCIRFAKRDGYGGIRVVNLFAYRSSHPADLLRCPVDVVGADNFRHLRECGQQAGAVVAAWGAHTTATALAVGNARAALRAPLMCFGTTASGAPLHPLARGRHRIPDDAPLQPYAPSRETR